MLIDPEGYEIRQKPGGRKRWLEIFLAVNLIMLVICL